MTAAAAESLGTLCIVLHGHLPYVLHHGTYPHGEAWLHEAAAETYLPLLEVLDAVAARRVRPALTIGLTPVLLEQLAHDRFKAGFVEYLDERVARATADARGFADAGQAHFVRLAERWATWYGQKRAQFDALGRDIPGAFARLLRDGQVQLLTSNATHGYMPLFLTDEALRAQVSCGVATSRRRLGAHLRGMWLPECAYRPSWPHWVPSVLYRDARPRVGLETFLADAGVTHFFVDTHMLERAEPVGTVKPDGSFQAVNDALLHWDVRRGWRSPLEPVGVVSEPGLPRVCAMARHPKVSEKVWSSVVGYPGTREYLEFHRKHGERGLRYHRVTSLQTPLHDKEPYEPDGTAGRTEEHAAHFCETVREVLREHTAITGGRKGVCVASFDAELFGHWWFEGVAFLQSVVLALARDRTVTLATAEDVIRSNPPDKVMRLPEGSWGEHGNHSVWINDSVRWLWEMEYRAEVGLIHALRDLPWRGNEPVRKLLEHAARELLLLQASDWPFVIHSRGAIDYGITRFTAHCNRFDRLVSAATAVAAGRELDAVQRVEVDEATLHDTVFPEIDLAWWL
jgi:1,4-alpha-glucan branching enzyme